VLLWCLKKCIPSSSPFLYFTCVRKTTTSKVWTVNQTANSGLLSDWATQCNASWWAYGRVVYLASRRLRVSGQFEQPTGWGVETLYLNRLQLLPDERSLPLAFTLVFSFSSSWPVQGTPEFNGLHKKVKLWMHCIACTPSRSSVIVGHFLVSSTPPAVPLGK
jgi:hypothetical protein